MKQDHPVRTAIDESLCGVRFDAKDMRAVLRETRNRADTPAPRAPMRSSRFSMALAMAMLLVLVLPAGYFALHAQGMRTTKILVGPCMATLAPQISADPQADRIITADQAPHTPGESEAIRIARACFESVCDTSLFTFEEYAVSAILTDGEGGSAEYTVEMDCIYGNGCRFTAVVALPEGRVVSHSSPALAAMPTYIDTSAPQVAAWYDKYGPYIVTWPQDAQAEFSRRYEGGMLRAARPGELTPDQAIALAKDLLRQQLPGRDTEAELYGYAMLCSERADAGGTARYAVSVYGSSITDTLPELLGAVTFRTDGSEAAVTIN